MANRLSSIVTRTGDDGTTGLGDGTRIRKDALRVVAMGDVDELNSCIGLLLSETLPEKVQELLLGVQHDLFDLGGQLCIPGHLMVTDAHVARLDTALAQFNAEAGGDAGEGIAALHGDGFRAALLRPAGRAESQ